MPATAEKHTIDYSEAVIVDSRASKRGARARTSSPTHWNQMEPLVAHFGDAAVAEPVTRPRHKSRTISPQLPPAEAPQPIAKITPRRGVRHQQFHYRPTAIIMCCTVLGLLLVLLSLHGATLALSRQDASVTSNIQISQEAIDNSNKSLAAIQVSPQTAQWAMTHGWHVANQGDFDEVPVTSNSGTAEVAQ